MNSPKLQQLRAKAHRSGRVAMVSGAGASLSLMGFWNCILLQWTAPAVGFGFVGLFALTVAIIYLSQYHRDIVAVAWQQGYEKAMEEREILMRRDGAIVRSYARAE